MFHVKRVRLGSGDRVATVARVSRLARRSRACGWFRYGAGAPTQPPGAAMFHVKQARRFRYGAGAPTQPPDAAMFHVTTLGRASPPDGDCRVSIRRWRAYSTTGRDVRHRVSIRRWRAYSTTGMQCRRGFDTALARLLNHRARLRGFDTALARLLNHRRCGIDGRRAYSTTDVSRETCAGFDTALARLLNHRAASVACRYGAAPTGLRRACGEGRWGRARLEWVRSSDGTRKGVCFT